MTVVEPKPRHLAPVPNEDDEASRSEADAPHRIDILVARAKDGDNDAWARLYQEEFDGLYRHIGYLTHDPVVAEDLVQEAFARALANLHRFDGRSAFSTWLRGIAINVVRKHWRGSSRRERAYKRLEHHVAARPRAGNPESSHLGKQRARVLLEIVETLPPKLREAYVLCDLRQLPRDEAAAQLDITAGNLSVRATRARARIRDELVRLGWLPGERGHDE
jgi:RNA polymerase sigma-70 factor (ECF subfamily)